MELLNKFKNYLLSNKTSKVTTKNYLADVRKFINWFEKQYQKPFHPKQVSNETIQQYKELLLTSNNSQSNETPYQTVASKSLQRYLSSLRKFFHFLTTEGDIDRNPFDQISNATTGQTNTDPLSINEFKNYLLSQKASPLTIKNYILDIKQFLTWAAQVIQNENPKAKQDKRLLAHITTLTLEEYKTRLRNEAKMSPVSINRKLSSIRKYFNWAAEKDYLKETITISPLQEKEALAKQTELATSAKSIEVPLKLENLINTTDTEIQGQTEEKKYASFGPIRLFQKINKGINLIFDLLIILPFTWLIKTTGHKIWEVNGREVFQPIEKIVALQKPELNLEDSLNTNPKSHSNLIQSIAKDSLTASNAIKTPRIHNIPKSIYAPLRISTKSFPFHKKVWHHLKHTRPEWYKRYRSYPLSNYFQAAILIIFITAISFSIYRAFIENPKHQNPALAALPTAPPRILSFQGRLTDASDNPLTAGRPLRFAIYNDSTASGAALLWQEIETVTPDQDGIFSTLLGNNVSIPSTLFSQNASLYLGITVGTDTELTPRQQLATVAYAANAETLQGLAPITQSGAGTNNVVLALDSTGNLTIGGSATPTFQASGGQFTLSGQALVLTTNAGSNTNVKIAPDGTGSIDLQKPLQNTSNNNNITSAKGAVEIDDIAAILASSSGQSALTINQTSTGPLISASTSGVAKFSVDNNGAGTFASDLAINGGNLTTTSTTFNLLNTGAINLNIGGAATAISIGAASGNTTINNTLLANNGITVASGKSLIVSGNVASNLIPSANNTYDLGSSTNYWNNLYVNNLIANSGATISGFWQRNSGVVTPANITDDLSVGGNATSSAKFQVFGNTGNATTSGNLTFTGTGSQIQTVKNQTLTVGGTSTGDIQFKPGNSSSSLYLASSGNLGVGTTTPRGTVDIADTGTPTLYVGGSNNGGDIIFHGSAANGSGIHYGNQELGIYSDQSNGINFYTSANQARVRIDNTGNVGIGTTNPSSFKLQVAGNVGPDATDTYDLGSASKEWNNLYVKNIITSATSGQNGFWQLNSGVLSPATTTNQLAIGQTTALASSGLDVEFNSKGNATAVFNNTGGSGDILTASSSGVNKFVITQNGNVGINTKTFTNANTQLQLLDTAATDQQAIAVFGDGNDSNRYQFLADRGSGGVFYMTSGTGAIRTLGSLSIQNNNTTNLYVSGTGNVGIGTTSPLTSTGLDIEKNSLGNASLVVNNSGGSGDILTASSAGTPKFVINKNGYVGIGTTTPLTNLDVQNSTSNNTGTYALQIKQNNASSYGEYIFVNHNSSTIDALNVQGWNGSSTINGLDVKGNGYVGIGTSSPTDPLTVAGNQTISGGELSVRGTAGTNTSDILIQHTGSTSTSNIQYALSDRSNNTDFWLYGYDGTNFWDPLKFIWNGGSGNQIVSLTSDGGSVGVGTTSPLSKSGIDIEKNSLGNAALAVNNSGGAGDLITASSSGTTKFNIDKSGNLTTYGGASITGQAPDGSGIQFAYDGAHMTLGTTGGTDLIMGAASGNIELLGSNLYGSYASGNNFVIDSTESTTKGNILLNPNGVTYGGSVAIGTNSPLTASGLDVESNSKGNAALVVNNTGGAGDLFTASSSGTAKFVIDKNGQVGIGTSLPGASLDLSTGTIKGAGLSSDCSSANSILQWSSSSKQFSCATSGSILVQKSADQSVTSSTTLTNDNDLKTASIPTNTAIVMHLVIHFQAGTTGQMKFAVTGPAGSALTGYARGFQNSGSGATGNGCAMVLNTSCVIPNTDTSELAIHIEIDAQTAGTAGAFTFQFAQNTSNGTATIVRKNSSLIYWILPNAADYAEVYYSKDGNIDPADVVSVDSSLKAGVKKSSKKYDSSILGVVSTKPAYLIGDSGDGQGKPVNLALSGRVPIKVNLENGAIKAGDYLTSSSTPGVAMKATEPGQVIGKALEDYNGPDDSQTGYGVISIFMNVGWANPNYPTITDMGNINISTDEANQYKITDNQGNIISSIQAFSQTIIANLQAGIIQSKKLMTDSLSITTENITIGGKTLRDYITSIVTDALSKQSLQNNKILNPIADEHIALKTDDNKINIFPDKNASGSAVASIDNQGNASFSGTLNSKDLQTQDATISGTLHVKNLIADNIAAATVSATYINNITNIYNSIATPSAQASASATPTPSPNTEVAASSSASNNPADYTPSTNVPLNIDYSDISSMAGLLSYAPDLSKPGSSLSDVSVAGQLSVGASMILADNSINTLGADLQVEPLRQGNIQFEGGLIAIDTDGNLNVGGNAIFAKDVTVKGTLAANLIAPVPDKDLIIKLGNPSPVPGQALAKAPELKVQNASGSSVFDLDQLGNVIASGSGRFAELAANALNIVKGAQADTSLTETVATSSAGTAIITANETERTIISPFVNKDSLIYLTATSDTQGVTPYVARQTEENPSKNTKGSFTIEIPYPVTKDIHINWWIVN